MTKKADPVTVYLSVPVSKYLPPDKVHPCRVKSRQLGRSFKSGTRFVRFAGVVIAVTVVVVNGPQGVG